MDRTLCFLLEKNHFSKGKIAFVVGPRQVGKTTLAFHLLKARNSTDLYRNWDDLEWRREVARQPYHFLDQYHPSSGGARPLAVLDEIHKFPGWKRYLKGLWDTRKQNVDLLVTGSGRLDVYQKGGDSLLGRYRQYRLHPLSLKEVLDPQGTSLSEDPQKILVRLVQGPSSPEARISFQQLLQWGGFPDPYLKQDLQESRLWHREKRRLIIREDLRDLTRIQLLSHIEELVELLPPRVAGLLSLNSLKEDLQVSLDSVRLWMGYLARLYFSYTLRPYSKKITRSLRKEPKLYLWDWSEVEEDGKRFENMIANHLLKWCHFTQDWGLEPLDLFFVRDKEKREVDFLITRSSKPWLLIEAKQSDTTPPSSLHHFGKLLGVENKILVVANLDRPGRAGDVAVLDAPTFLSNLPV